MTLTSSPQPDYLPNTNELLPPEFWPNVDDLVTEDDTPVDNIFSEKTTTVTDRIIIHFLVQLRLYCTS